MPWFHAVAERDHELQNPTSVDKIRLLGEHLRLRSDSHVLDVASGRGGPAVVLAETFGCRVTGVEKSIEFFEVARERADRRGVSDRVEFVLADARDYALERETYDVSMCLGATFIWGGLEAAVATLLPAAKRRGYVVVGEPYWRGNAPAGDEFSPLPETVARFERPGLPLVAMIASSDDDWDRYESLHWRALEEFLAEDDDADIRAQHEHAKSEYLARRERFGWAIFVGWKS